MTSKRARIEAALAGEIADRPPVSFWRAWPGDDQVAATHAAMTLAYQKEFDWDFIKVTTSGTAFHLEDWGVKTQVSSGAGGNREIAQNPYKNPSDWSRLPRIDVTQGSHGEHLRCLRMIGKEIGEETPFVFSVFSPSTVVERLVGAGEMVFQARRNPELLHGLLEKTAEMLRDFVREGLRTGAAGIFFATATTSYRTWSEAEYREFGRQYDLPILQEAADAGWFNILHLHGPDPIFAAALDYPVQVLNWDDRATPPTLAEARSRYGGPLMGGLHQNTTLLRGTPEEVEAEARDAFSQVGRRGFILSAGCSISATIPTCNLHAARRIVETLRA